MKNDQLISFPGASQCRAGDPVMATRQGTGVYRVLQSPIGLRARTDRARGDHARLDLIQIAGAMRPVNFPVTAELPLTAKQVLVPSSQHERSP